MALEDRGRDALLVVAIDFGTSYSGYASQFYHEYQRDPVKMSSPQAWNSGKKNLISLKTPTCLLLNEKKELHECAFGYAAEDAYASLCSSKENYKYYFFRRFKMKLQDGKSLTKSSIIEDETGKTMLTLEVFALSIKCLIIHLMNMLEKEGTGVEKDDIFFVLTVPAIWSDAAKMFMREAAQNAGIRAEKLEIALEPEAASLFCQYVPVSSMRCKEDQVHFASTPPGTKYMVADLGGGTADITVHEKQRGGGLKEVCRASGGPWGGIAVDNAFLQILIDIVRNNVVARWKNEETYDYLDLCREFETAKRCYGRQNRNKIIIRLPATLNDLCQKILKGDLQTHLAKSGYRKDITIKADKMMIEPKLVEELFREVTNHIIDHMQGILKQRHGSDISFMLMVGGFSESPFVQDVIMEAFHGKNGRKVIFPRDADIIIAKGAVLFGRMPYSVDTRVLRFTYGVNRNPIFVEGVHPEDKKLVTDRGTQCKDVFDILVSADSEVKTDFSVKRTYCTAFDFQKWATLELYYTNDKNPKYTTDSGCKYLGKLDVKIPKPSKGKRWVDVTFQFGMTELRLQATERSNNIPCIVSFKFIE